MKKLVLTISLVLALGLASFAQQSGGMMRRSKEYRETYRNPMNNPLRGETPYLPNQFGSSSDYDSTSSLGSGIAVLLGLGAVYCVRKKRKEE